MTHLVRTVDDFNKLTFTITTVQRGYPVIITKDECKERFDEVDCISYLECAEIAANHGFVCDNGDIIKTSI